MTNKIPNILGDQLKDAREKAGFSLEALAKKASLSFKQLEEMAFPQISRQI
jgi:transcriptional regulator with XRE-family HTH domain